MRRTLDVVGVIAVTLLCGAAFAADTASAPRSLDLAYRSMYNLDFDAADQEIRAFRAQHPQDPMGPVSEAASALFSIFEKHSVLQYEIFRTDDEFTKRRRISPDPADVERLDRALNAAELLANERLRTNATDNNATFALTLTNGLRADYAALVLHQDFTALKYSRRASESAEQLIKRDPNFYDAYLATGIQKYLVSLRAAPVRWFLRLGGIKGDQDEGLEELARAADKGRLLAPFARIIIAGAHLRNGRREQALALLTRLERDFPANPLFSREADRIRESTANRPQ